MKYTEHFFADYHKVVVATCEKSDLRAVIAVHNINLGPALGGCRVLEYSDLDSQIADTMKLAKGMTYKSALAGNKLGGGKATIQGPLTTNKMKAFADFLNWINKEYPMYYTAADVGTNKAVLEKIAEHTQYVNYKGSDCSIATAWGVFYAMQGACEYLDRDLKKEVVSVLGYGKVGRRLGDILMGNNTRHMASDIIEPFKSTGALSIKYELIPNLRGYIDYRTAHYKGTMFAPCALGGVINERSIGDIPNSHIICGGANNQLISPMMETHIISKDITYVPDYVANAGGIIIVAEQGNEKIDLDYDHKSVLPRLRNIRKIVYNILDRADKEKLSTVAVSNKMAEEIFNG